MGVLKYFIFVNARKQRDKVPFDWTLWSQNKSKLHFHKTSIINFFPSPYCVSLLYCQLVLMTQNLSFVEFVSHQLWIQCPFFFFYVPTSFLHFVLPSHILNIWKTWKDEYVSNLTVKSLGFAAGRNVSASFVNKDPGLLKKLRLSWTLEIKCSGLASVWILLFVVFKQVKIQIY